MSGFASCLYDGVVVHKRLVPRQHAFSYRVFALCLDVDEIDRLDTKLRLFSRNRFNLLSFHDRDLGDGLTALVAVFPDPAGLDELVARVEAEVLPANRVTAG